MAFSFRAMTLVPHASRRRLCAGIVSAFALASFAACGGGGDGPTSTGPISRIEVSSSVVTLNTIGATDNITATPRDADGKALTVSVAWTVDNATIATVTQSGNSVVITARAPGATVAHARVGTTNADVSIQVRGVRSLQVNPTTATVRAGDTQPFTTTFDADPGVSTAVTWTSDNTAVATVNASGVVTGVTPGTATVRATSVFDSRVSATAAVTITPSRGVVLNPTTANIATAEQLTIQATLNIDNSTNLNLTWRSSAPAVATVNQQGRVTGVAFGTTTITALAQADTTLRATATINVVPVIRNVTVSPTTANILAGNTQQLTSTVTAEGSLATTVTWRTSNPAIATVSGAGLVTAVALGSATITAVSTADTTKRATSAITVSSRPIAVAITPRPFSLNPGVSSALTATVSADPGVSTAVSWASATPSVATISATGVVTALTLGTTVVTATSQADNSKRDTITVSVVPRLAANWSGVRMNGALFDDLLSVVPLSPNFAFAVNAINGGTTGGDVYRWNGSTWALSLSGATMGTKFQAVHGTSTDFAIAVGTNGVIAKWDGTTWTKMTSPTTGNLRSVWVEGPTSAFAVGDNGTAVRFIGTFWVSTNTNSTVRLNGVWANAGIAYAVGAAGTVLRFNGASWAPQTVPFNDDLYAVAGLATGQITAVGAVGGVVRFDGIAWSLINSNGIIDNFYAVTSSALNGGRSYIGGDVGVYQIDGSTITASNAPYPVSTYSVMIDAAGVLWTSGQRGAVQRLSSGNWETLNIAPDLLDVWTTSASNAWAVGEYGFVLRWNGSSWQRQSTPSLATLYSVWALSSNEAFAGGDNGTLLRWNGTAWTSMSFPTTSRVFAIWGTAANNVFAATDVGEILRYNGTAWALQTTVTGNATLLGLYGSSATDAYVVGTGGTMLRYNGTTWSAFNSPDAVSTLFGIWTNSPNNIFTVGTDVDGQLGRAFNYNGTSWQSTNVGTAKALTSVWGPSTVDLYATGDAGTLLRFNGTTWQSVPTGTTDLLWAVSGAPDGSGGAFAVGINTTIVTGTGGSGSIASALRSVNGSRNLEPSAAALRDPKASGAAARGAARRDRAIRSSSAARAAAFRASAARAAGQRSK